jgi:hypothetical protein
MRRVLGTKQLEWAKFAAVPLLALLIGIGVAIASSTASLTRDHRSVGSLGLPSPTPSPAQATPIPTVTQAGVFGSNPHLQAVGSSGLFVQAPNLAAGSADGGKTWSSLGPPSNGAGIAIDGANPLHGISGGATIQVTADGGRSWQPVKTPPPGQGPYKPVAISPFDGSVWFLIHQGTLLRSRDASLTWREFNFATLTSPVMTPGPVVGEFFLASGSRVFQLIDNGQGGIVEEPALPAGGSVVELAAVGGDKATLIARLANNGLYLLKAGVWSALTGATGGSIASGADGVLVVGNGGAKLGSLGAVAYSVDLGTTWGQAQGLPYDQSVEAIAGQPSSATFFAYCYGGDIYMSSDGGRSWSVLTRALRSRTG